jgi:hypothetical protein
MKQKQKGKRLYPKKTRAHLVLWHPLIRFYLKMKMCAWLSCVIVVVEHQKVRPPNVMHFFFFLGAIWINESTTPNAFKFPSTEYLPFFTIWKVCVLSVSGLSNVCRLALDINTSVARTLERETDLTYRGNMVIQKVTLCFWWLCWNWLFSPPNRLTLSITLNTNLVPVPIWYMGLIPDSIIPYTYHIYQCKISLGNCITHWCVLST